MQKGMWSVVLLAVMALAGAQERPPVAEPDVLAKWEPPALAWIKSNAVPFRDDAPPTEDLKTLVEAIKGARVVGIGEPTHGDATSQKFKAQLIRELVRTGQIDTLMLEVNREGGSAFDRYVNEGKGDFGQLMADSGIFSIWRTDEFAGLMAWLRGWVIRTGAPVRIYGVDCQDFLPDARLATKFLDRSDRALARRLRTALRSAEEADKKDMTFYAWLKSISKDEYKVTAGLMTEVVAKFESQKVKWGAREGFEEAAYSAQTALQSLQAFEFEVGPDPVDFTKIPVEYGTRRDRFMGDNLLKRLGKGRAALWAHDSHTVGSVPAWIEAIGYVPLGFQVRKMLKHEYVALGFAWTEGRFHARSLTQDIVSAQRSPFSVYSLPNNLPGDLGEFLARVGHRRFWVDFRKADEATKTWGQIAYFRGWAGWGVDPKTWQKDPTQEAAPVLPLHDILVYFREISPSNLWNLPVKK